MIELRRREETKAIDYLIPNPPYRLSDESVEAQAKERGQGRRDEIDAWRKDHVGTVRARNMAWIEKHSITFLMRWLTLLILISLVGSFFPNDSIVKGILAVPLLVSLMGTFVFFFIWKSKPRQKKGT